MDHLSQKVWFYSNCYYAAPSHYPFIYLPFFLLPLSSSLHSSCRHHPPLLLAFPSLSPIRIRRFFLHLFPYFPFLQSESFTIFSLSVIQSESCMTFARRAATRRGLARAGSRSTGVPSRTRSTSASASTGAASSPWQTPAKTTTEASSSSPWDPRQSWIRSTPYSAKSPVCIWLMLLLLLLLLLLL